MRPTRAAVAAIAALVLAGSGCAADDIGSGPETLRVYVSAPLQGARATEGRAIEDGARLALAEAGGRVGRLRIRGVFLDDSDAGGWSIARTAANARRAGQDVSTIGYVGDLDSGATRVSLPITNQAQIAQVSPGSTAVDLTRVPRFGGAGPDRYQPSGKQTFARVVPDDDVQGRAAASWVRQIGIRTVASVNDGSAFGRNLERAFDQAAGEEGLRLKVGGRAAGQDPIRSSASGAVYYGGSADTALTSLRLIADGAPTAKIFGSDALLDPAFSRSAAAYADRLRLTSAFLDPTLLPPRGHRFVRDFRARFRSQPEPAAAYGYEAMALLLDAIRHAGGSGDARGAVIDELLATSERRSVLGTYSIDGNGDTTLDAVSGYRISDGLPVFPVKLTAPR